MTDRTDVPANCSEYTAHVVLPGDHVTLRAGRKIYLVVGAEYYGGEYRVALSAISGGFKASSADSVHPRDLTLAVVDPYEPAFRGARASKLANDAFRRVINRLTSDDCKWLQVNSRDGRVTIGPALALLRARFMPEAKREALRVV